MMVKDFEEEEFREFKFEEEKPLEDGQLLEVTSPSPLPSTWKRLPALIVLIGVALFLIWGIVTKILPGEKYGSLSIVSNPPGALVYLDNQEKGLTPIYLPKIEAKEYNLKVTRGGFNGWSNLVKLEHKKTLELKIDLEDVAPPEIMSSPLSKVNPGEDLRIEATVKDNFQVGTVNLFYRKKNTEAYTCVKMIDSGNDIYWAVIHGPFITKEGMEYYIKATDGVNEITYPENPLTPQIASQITPSVSEPQIDIGSGNLTISSSPSEAEVYIDGKLEKSTTPIENISLREGKYGIRICQEGYLPWQGSVLIKKGKKNRLSVILKTKLSSIFVDSNIKGANVFINKKPYGKTPLRIKDLTPEIIYNVEVEHNGEIVYSSTVSPKTGEEKKIFIELATKLGKAYITSLPYGAKIYTGGKLLGITPLRNIKMPVGEHILKAEKEGFPEVTKTIRIIENKISFSNFDLESKE
ncbi:PEGA domain-containing protein [bacterium]|nr:PEGA domain-containing protein [bacterium]MBU1153104.1 PEGA domain-containing protein [bacterium]